MLFRSSPIRAIRGATAGQYRVVYQYLDQMWERWQNHVLRDRSIPVTPNQPDFMRDYMDWYRRISHLTIQHPDHRATYGEQQTTIPHTVGDIYLVRDTNTLILIFEIKHKLQHVNY